MKYSELSEKLKKMQLDVGVDFSNLESLEVSLTEFAHALASVEPDGDNDRNTLPVPAQGRALKGIVPAWADYLRTEMKRDEAMGPASAIIGLTRAFAMLVAITCLPAAKSRPALHGLMRNLGQVFSDDLAGYAQGVEEEANEKKR